MENNNRIKGIIGLMDITARFDWDKHHEFPTNRLDNFVFSEEYAERMSSYVLEEIPTNEYNDQYHTLVTEELINELTENKDRKDVLIEKLNNKYKTLVVKKAPVKAGSKIEFLFRAKGLCSSVTKVLHAVTEFVTKEVRQTENLRRWLISQDKWFRPIDGTTTLFELDAISNVSATRDNLVARLLSGANELYAELEDRDIIMSEESIKKAKIQDLLEKNKEYFCNNTGLQKVMIGIFRTDTEGNKVFVQIKDNQRKPVEFQLYILMDFAYQLATHNASGRAKNKKYDKFYFDLITTYLSKTSNKKLLDKLLYKKINGSKIQQFIIAGNINIE